VDQTNNNTEEWNEALRLLHKFCPAANFITSLRELNMDNIFTVLAAVDPDYISGKLRTLDDSRTTIERTLGETLQREHDRVLVIPDLEWAAKPPILCAATRLLERIDEGAKVIGDDRRWEFIDGCSDVLFVFETTGRLLFFDHEDGYSLATPSC